MQVDKYVKRRPVYTVIQLTDDNTQEFIDYMRLEYGYYTERHEEFLRLYEGAKHRSLAVADYCKNWWRIQPGQYLVLNADSIENVIRNEEHLLKYYIKRPE